MSYCSGLTMAECRRTYLVFRIVLVRIDGRVVVSWHGRVHAALASDYRQVGVVIPPGGQLRRRRRERCGRDSHDGFSRATATRT